MDPWALGFGVAGGAGARVHRPRGLRQPQVCSPALPSKADSLCASVFSLRSGVLSETQAHSTGRMEFRAWAWGPTGPPLRWAVPLCAFLTYKSGPSGQQGRHLVGAAGNTSTGGGASGTALGLSVSRWNCG